VGGGRHFPAIRGGFGTLCRRNLGVWVAGGTFMPSGVDLVHCAVDIPESGTIEILYRRWADSGSFFYAESEYLY
jgi:hypothetical protein